MPFTDEQIARMTPEQKQQAIQSIEQELERRKKPQGILPNVLSGLKNFAIGGLRTAVGQNPEGSGSDITKLMNEQVVKNYYEQQDPYKQSQIKLNEAMLKNIEGGGAGGDLIYRDPSTGMEIPKEQAIADIGQGKQYIVKRRVATRQGIKEEDVSKPEDLTQEEKTYMITADRVKGSLSALQNDVYPKLDKLGGSKDWQAFQAQNMPFWAIGNQDIEDYKSALTQLKADIPFLRGGKQLTATEAKRVDILLNPFGKSPETRQKDIQRFQTEFLGGQELMKGGIRELNRRVGGQYSAPTKPGGQLMVDAQGNKAIVYSDGTIEEQ